MWSDVVIGNGNRGNSATIISLEGVTNISENSRTYWISDCYLGAGMTIFKDTSAGQVLADLISAKSKPEVIDAFLSEVFLKHIPPEQLKVFIDRELSRAFTAGADAKAAQIRNALCI